MMARSDTVSGSALVPSAGDGVSPSRTFIVTCNSEVGQHAQESLFRRDAETSTRDARATNHAVTLINEDNLPLGASNEALAGINQKNQKE